MKESPHGKGMTILFQIKKKYYIVFNFSKYFYLFFTSHRITKKHFAWLSDPTIGCDRNAYSLYRRNSILSCLINDPEPNQRWLHSQLGHRLNATLIHINQPKFIAVRSRR